MHRLDRTNAFPRQSAARQMAKPQLQRLEQRAGAGLRLLPTELRQEEKYPLLRNSIHGGPHAAHMDTWHYRWNVYAFAAQNYVVARRELPARPALTNASSASSTATGPP